MRGLFYVVLLVCIGQTSYSQAVLPATDYAVYSAVIDGYSHCANSLPDHRRGGLLLIDTTTATLGSRAGGFSFDFSKTRESIETMMVPPKDDFYKRSDWTHFFNTVDTTQFTSYSLTRLPVFACRQSAWWTPERSARYFNRQGGRGYSGLRNDYASFGGLIRFSKVAYSPDGTKATCYYSESNDYENGAGYVVFLEKKGGFWQLLVSVMLWIS